MLALENITKSFGGVRAIQGSTFVVRPGEITALIGPNGAGKTTLFDIICGYVAPDSGRVIFADRDITRDEAFSRVRQGISRTWQQPRLFKNLTVTEHVRMVEDHADAKLFQNVFGRPAFARRASAGKQDVELLKKFGIEKSPDTKVSELSFGQRKLLQMALAIRQPHRLLMFDEPVAGVNSLVQAQIEKLLRGLKAAGETIVLIDHDMQFIRSLADRVIVLDAGTVLTQGSPEAVFSDPQVLAAYLGI